MRELFVIDCFEIGLVLFWFQTFARFILNNETTLYSISYQDETNEKYKN